MYGFIRQSSRPYLANFTWLFNNRLPVQVCDRNAKAAPATKTMAEFLKNAACFYVIIYDNDSLAARADTAHFARMVVQQRYWVDTPYCPLSHNCEHFTAFCRVGHKFSEQSLVWTTFILGSVAPVSGIEGCVLMGSAMGAASYFSIVHRCIRLSSTYPRVRPASSALKEPPRKTALAIPVPKRLVRDGMLHISRKNRHALGKILRCIVMGRKNVARRF